MNTKDKILALLENNGRMRPAEIVEQTGVSRQFIQEQLAKLVEAGQITRAGSTPEVFYSLAAKPTTSKLPQELAEFLQKNYLYISPDGVLEYGEQGMEDWAKRSGQTQPLEKLALEYQRIRTKANSFFDNSGLIQGEQKLLQTFGKNYLKSVFFSDFYSLPQFGKTRLGQLMLYAKQSQNSSLIKRIALEIAPKVQGLAAREQITAVAYVPPSIPRKVQFLSRLKWDLGLNLPEILLTKNYLGEVRVAQKTLKSLDERIDNARIIDASEQSRPQIVGQSILLIDDALGSGATMNEVAAKLRSAGAKAIYGYAITGSFNGFDVVREV